MEGKSDKDRVKDRCYKVYRNDDISAFLDMGILTVKVPNGRKKVKVSIK